jgi:hypothetical protein
MNKHKEQTGDEKPKALPDKTEHCTEVFRDAFNHTYSPIEWLQYKAYLLENMADSWDEYDSNYIREDIAFEKTEYPKKKKIEMYDEIAGHINENVLHDLICGNSDEIKEIEQNRESIVKAFANTAIYPNLLKVIAIIEQVVGIAKTYEFSYWYQLYFCCCTTADEAKEWFGGDDNQKRMAADRFKRNPKLTISNYENAFDYITGLFKELEKRRFSAALRESLWVIEGYCKLNDKNYDKTQSKIAERYEIAYLSFQYAEEKTGDNLTDKQAYDYLKEHGAENIEGFELKDFDTWQRYVRGGRKHHGTPKNTFRAGRICRSAVKISEVDARQITNQINNSTDTD